MRVNNLQTSQLISSASQKNNEHQSDFRNFLEEALDKVNDLQLEADRKTIDFALGGLNAPDIHNVMISMEKAGLALSLTIEVRNKLLESYQEIMRMQV